MSTIGLRLSRRSVGLARRARRARAGLGIGRICAVLAAVVAPVWAIADNAALAADCADVDLVLAIDGSGSIDPVEFALQQLGYSSAFRRADVQEALRAAGTVDVAVVFWGDSEIAVQILPWMRLTDGHSATAFAAKLDGVVRSVEGDTGIGRGLTLALDLLEMPGQCGHRKIVNVSGDGYESVSARARHHVPLSHARRRAAGMEVVVNALAIENEAADLADWYTAHLITGPGAFAMRVGGFDTFADAIALKLIREIAPPNLAQDHSGRMPPALADRPASKADRNT